MYILKKFIALLVIVLFAIQFIIVLSLSAIYYLFRFTLNFIFFRQTKVINPFKKIHPDVFKDSMQMITLDGFQIKSYKFKTQDGYSVSAWRIINENTTNFKQQPVLLQHGLLDCSITWFLHQNKKNSLPYILSQQGYDVWIGNNRGTKYSKDQCIRSDYWSFCFDHLVQYDVPAMIDGILKQSGKQEIHFIGHSQGSTQLFAALTQNQQIKDKIRCFISLGPVISLANVKNHLVMSILSKTPILQIYKTIGFSSVLHLPNWMNKCVGILIYNTSLYFKGFLQIVNLLCGEPNENKIDLSRLGVIIAHEPGGSSTDNIMQWVQFIRNKQFTKFNYGKAINKQIYGSQQAPEYKFQRLESIKFNKYLFRGTKDSVISDQDFNYLLSCLDKQTTHCIDLADYAHLDYIWSVNAHLNLYSSITTILNSESTIYQV